MEFKFEISEDVEKQLDLLNYIALLKVWSPSQKVAKLILSLPEDVRSNLTAVRTILCDVKQDSDASPYDILKDELWINLKKFFFTIDHTKLFKDAQIRPGESIPIFALRMKSLLSLSADFTESGKERMLREKILGTLPKIKADELRINNPLL